MVTARNIIMFGEPSNDSRFLLNLLGISVTVNPNVLPPFRTFEAQVHSIIIARNEFKLYNITGLHSDVSDLSPREALGNLYRLTRAFDGGVHLLIYLVGNKHSVKNVKIFHDYLCSQDVPIILTSNRRPPAPSLRESENLPVFKEILTLNGTNPERDRDNLHDAIRIHTKRDSRNMLPIDRFEMTATKVWKLLERTPGWSIPMWRDAFKATLTNDAFFSEKEAVEKCQSITDYMKSHYSHNVIIFGDTGAGKTSVVKMLTDKVELDKKASSAGGSTFESKAYEVDINEYPYVIHDTVGLDDGTSATLSPHQALQSLYQLLLKVEGGISLLVYVHRGKITPSQVENYKLFSQVICKSMVPTALVVTGLEEVESRDDWWQANRGLFNGQGIATKYYACITSTKGKFNRRHKEYAYQDQYDESKLILKDLFLNAPLRAPWKVPCTPHWWKSLVVEVYNTFAARFKWTHLVANESLYRDLMRIGGMDEDQAKVWANNIDRVPSQRHRPRPRYSATT